MLPTPSTDPFRSLTLPFPQYAELRRHLEDAQHAAVLISEVLGAQVSGKRDDTPIATRTFQALIDRAAAVEQHLDAIETLLEKGGA